MEKIVVGYMPGRKGGTVRWTDELLAVLRQWREVEGLTVTQMTERLEGASWLAVRSVIARERWSFPKPAKVPDKYPEKRSKDGPAGRHPLRVSAGWEPLPAGHPLSWGVIATGTAFPAAG